MWYTYLKSAGDRAIIRECFSTSILLGSINDPIEPQSEVNLNVHIIKIRSLILIFLFSVGPSESTMRTTRFWPAFARMISVTD